MFFWLVLLIFIPISYYLLLCLLYFGKGKKNTLKKQIITNGYKYQWNQSSKNNTNCYIYHLLCVFAIPSSERSPGTNNDQLNKDDKTQALFDERSSIEFM